MHREFSMSGIIKLEPPLSKGVISSLKVGDHVKITGTVYTARDIAHKRLCRAIEMGEALPFDLEGAIIYYVGPTPARPGKVIGAAGPTTSSRMDAFTPALLARGLKATIGKGYRGDEIRQALQDFCAVHLAATGGAGALLSQYITESEIIAYDDLGTEAVRRLRVVDFPAVVAYDAQGNSVYKEDGS